MNLILIIIISYLLGSIPTAYLILKKIKGIDIRKAGSGNVGGMNAFEVSGKKIVGITVFLIDFLKGFLAVTITKELFENNFLNVGLAVIFVVFGHCFSIWIGFKGGRGLATALGSTFSFIPSAFIIWGIVWLITYLFKKDIHLGNIWATISTMILLLINYNFFNQFNLPKAEDQISYSLVVIATLSIILVKHLEPLRMILSKREKNEV